MRWPLQPLQPLQQTQLQPPFGQSVDSLCHPWFTTTNVSYRFPILKLPPPPCAVLLVNYEFFWTWGIACNLSSFHGKNTTNHRILGHRLFGSELGISVDLTPRFWVEHGPALAMGNGTYEVFLSFSGKFHGIVFFPTPIVRFDYQRVVKNDWIYIANNTGRLPNKI